MVVRAERESGPERGAGGMTAIVAAMEEEIAPLRARLTGLTALAASGVRVSLGRLGGAPVALVVTGDGASNARRGLAALLAVVAVRRVVIVGVAGGLGPELDVAGLLVADRVVDEATGAVLDADAALTELVARTSGAGRGTVVSAVRIADTAHAKERLRELAARSPGAGAAGAAGDDRLRAGAVVDLESAAFAAAATRASLPWTVLRAVSDPAGESVPALLNRSRDAGGAVRRGRVVLGLLSSPGDLRRLLVLRDRVRTCAGVLAGAVEDALAALGAADLGAAAAPTSSISTLEDNGSAREA